jgi:hypothetical protein
LNFVAAFGRKPEKSAAVCQPPLRSCQSEVHLSLALVRKSFSTRAKVFKGGMVLSSEHSTLDVRCSTFWLRHFARVRVGAFLARKH